MAGAAGLRRMALALVGTTEAPHCRLAPEVFTPINNAWGRQGWTTANLAAASSDDLQAALEMAYAHAVSKPKRSSQLN